MTQRQLLSAVLQGEFVVVGELRGVRPEDTSVFDDVTGEAIPSARAIYLIERLHSGMTVPMTIYQKFPDFVAADEACSRYRKGKRYAFYLESLYRTSGYWAGWIGEREPKPIGARRPSQGRRALAYP
jgi:hypothetical protein